MKLIKRSFQDITKEASKPTLGSFYIVNGAIIYSTLDNGIDHPELWKQFVLKSNIFDNIGYENKMELIEAPYGTDRGRLTWVGAFKADDTPDLSDPKGYFNLFGTPGCAKYAQKLKRIFHVDNLRKGLEVKEDFKSDSHYKIQKQNENILKDMIQLAGKNKLEHLNNMRLAQVISDPLKNIIRRRLRY